VAGIEYENKEGFADFHALRHTFIPTLAKSNAPVKIVQSLARHSTPVLTLGVYPTWVCTIRPRSWMHSRI
jgi:integrase